MESTNRDINALALLGIQATAYSSTFIIKEPCRNSPHTGWKFMMEILGGHEKRCHEMFRMEKHVFRELCDTLKGYGLKSTRGIPVEEAVGMFLMTLGHGIGNRMIQERFQHSGETVSRQFSNVLNYMSTFTMEMIKPHDNYNEVPNHIRQNPKYHPYFRARWAILERIHSYEFDKQVTIVAASMALHNFIRKKAIADIEFQQYDENEDYLPTSGDGNESEYHLTIDDSEMGIIRDKITLELIGR
ncbi:hypothetical protein L1049_025638 [Liquidambar formosana]|uniref:DUF8040 domain-containing protein n=1 Tax=Liquidambar formosana TaxID=63359 RepID=A0AAP0NE11_LIQFO